MTPVDQDGDRERFGITAQSAWRGVIVFIGVVLMFVVIATSVGLYLLVSSVEDNHRAIHKSSKSLRGVTELSCQIGSFFIGQPIERQPGTTRADFVETIGKAIALLRSLREVDCSDVKGARITTAELHRGLRKLREAGGIAGQAPGGGEPSGSPPGNSQPGGGSSGHHPPPDNSGEPPPGTSTTTTTAPPPPERCILHRRLPICLHPPLG